MALLEIDGDVGVAHSFDAAELALLPDQLVERSLLLGGRAIGGVRLSTVVAKLDVMPSARFAILRSSDGSVAHVPVAALADCVLIYRIGDEVVPRELGGPLRVVTRELERGAQVRALCRITFAAAAAQTTRGRRRTRLIA